MKAFAEQFFGGYGNVAFWQAASWSAMNEMI